MNEALLAILEGVCQLTRWEAESILKLARQRGITASELLREDPYSLARLEGWSFTKADRVALKAGVEPEDPSRLQAALVHALTRLCEEEGHTACAATSLVQRTARRLGVPLPPVWEALSALAIGGRVIVSELSDLRDDERVLVALPDLYLAELRVLRAALRVPRERNAQ